MSLISSILRIIISQKLLLALLQRAASVAQSKTSAAPVLSHALIVADVDQISVCATDMDMEITSTAPADIQGSGAFTVNAAMAASIVSKLPPGNTTLEFNSKSRKVTISSGRSKFDLDSLDADDFPHIASEQYQTSIDVPAESVKRLLGKPAFCISTEETRYYLNGVFLHRHAETGQLAGVATDGHRLFLCRDENTALENGHPGIIVPRKTSSEIVKAVSGMVRLDISATKVRASCEGFTLVSKVIDGTFPDYVRVIPTAAGARMTADAKELRNAVDRVVIVVTERARAVKMTAADDLLKLKAASSGVGESEDELTVAYAGEPIVTGFNAKYLLDALGAVTGENVIMELIGPGEACRILDSADQSSLQVLMPMRV